MFRGKAARRPPWTCVRLKRLKYAFKAENFIHKLSWSISSHFVAIQSWNVRCSQKLRKIHQKSLEIFWWFRVIDVDKSKTPVSAACLYISATIFTLDKPISAKKRHLDGTLFDALVRGGTPSHRSTKFHRKKLESLGQPMHSKDFVILARTVSIGLKGVTDERTDGRTPRL